MSAFFTTSFPTTNLGDQAQTKRLISDAVISPVFYQPTEYLGTRASPVDITLINSLNYIQGVNKYVFYVFLTTTGTPVVGVGCQVINCPLNILDTFSATTYNNFYSVPSPGIPIQAQKIYDCAQITPTSISSSIDLINNVAGTYKFKMIISLTPESG